MFLTLGSIYLSEIVADKIYSLEYRKKTESTGPIWKMPCALSFISMDQPSHSLDLKYELHERNLKPRI
jgi:hypothetical protein